MGRFWYHKKKPSYFEREAISLSTNRENDYHPLSFSLLVLGELCLPWSSLFGVNFGVLSPMFNDGILNDTKTSHKLNKIIF